MHFGKEVRLRAGERTVLGGFARRKGLANEQAFVKGMTNSATIKLRACVRQSFVKAGPKLA